jgi:hypothetical protein
MHRDTAVLSGKLLLLGKGLELSGQWIGEIVHGDVSCAMPGGIHSVLCSVIILICYSHWLVKLSTPLKRGAYHLHN